MNILVCVELIPEIEKIAEAKNEKSLNLKNVPVIVNPMDKTALFAALDLKKENPENIDVFTLTIGPKTDQDKLKTISATGLTGIYLMTGRGFGSSDASGIAYLLSKGIKEIEKERDISFDLILCGGSFPNSLGAGLVGPYLADELKIKEVSNFKSFKLNSKRTGIKVNLALGGEETINFPCLLTIGESFEKSHSKTHFNQESPQVEIIEESKLENLDQHKFGILGAKQTVMNSEIIKS